MPRRRRSRSSTDSRHEDPARPPRARQRQRSVSRDHRRRDSQSGSDVESAAGKTPKTKKTQYTPVEEKMRTIGRGFGIFHEMWRSFDLIIDKGLEASAADLSALSEVDRPYVNSFRTLLDFSPTVSDEIVREGGDTAKIGSLLGAARGDTRRTHASGMKKSVSDWHNFSPGLSKTGLRGWDHDECARLLCPPSIEWNETNKKELKDPVARARFKLGPQEFPRFLWEGEIVDDLDPTIGFLRHSMLFAALRHLTISPSNGVDPKSNVSTKTGYAKQCGVKHVTIESIAYAAMMVRFGLSSDKRFSSNSNFKYKDMYYAIIKFVKVWPEAKVQQLLAKWDREIFSQTQTDDQSGDEDIDPDSLAARLTRQVGAMMAQGS